MLVLTRKRGEFIQLGNDVIVKIIRTDRGTVKLGIAAPAEVRVLRAELAEFKSDSEMDLPEDLGGDEVGIRIEGQQCDDAVTATEFSIDPEIEIEHLLLCTGSCS